MPKEKEVITAIRKRLEVYEHCKVVVWHDRIQSGAIRIGAHRMRLAKAGTPDFIAVIRNTSKNLSLFFIEAKGDGGTLRDTQIEFRDKYFGIKDVHYLVCNHPKQIDEFIGTYGYDYTQELPDMVG